MARILEQDSQNIYYKTHSTEDLVKPRRSKDDFTLFICDRCKRQCALLTKEIHKPLFCPFLEFEKDNSSHIFKF